MKKLNFSRRKYWASVSGAVVLVLAMLGTSPSRTNAQEQQGMKADKDAQVTDRTTAQEQEGLKGDKDVKVVDRDSVAYGRTYGEWMAAWDQWSYSLPIDTHPLFTDGDCSVGQSGPVWFLGGAFVAPLTRVRHCNIPAGTALFFPVWDWEDSALEESIAEHPGDPAYQQIAGLRSFVFQLLNQYVNPQMFCQIDHKRIPNFLEDFRIQSTAFGFTIPENNLLNAIYGMTFEAGTYFPAVDDGWDVMLAPLPPGDHVLVFGSTDTITYYLHVAKESAPAAPPAGTASKQKGRS